jgi:hypothetical protein
MHLNSRQCVVTIQHFIWDVIFQLQITLYQGTNIMYFSISFTVEYDNNN